MKPITDKKLLSELPFHNILIKKPVSKPFTNRKILSELSFYKRFLEKPNITKKFKIFKTLCTKVYSRSVKLNEMKGFKF